MRVVKYIDNVAAGNVTTTIDLRAIGGCGVIYQGLSEAATAIDVHFDQGDGTFVGPYIHSGAVGALNVGMHNHFGFNCIAKQVKFAHTGAGGLPNRFAIAIVDEPIAPFGRVLVFENNATTAPGVTADVYTLQPLGIPATMECVVTGDRAFTIKTSVLAYSVSQSSAPAVRQTAVAGGRATTGRISSGLMQAWQVRNDDGALNLAWTAHVWAWFGQGADGGSRAG